MENELGFSMVPMIAPGYRQHPQKRLAALAVHMQTISSPCVLRCAAGLHVHLQCTRGLCRLQGTLRTCLPNSASTFLMSPMTAAHLEGSMAL